MRAFCRARRGNVAITFAFAVIPVIGFIGAAYDYSHANSVKADMQAALDATALMLAKDAATLNQTALSQKAAAYFTALFKRPEATITSIERHIRPQRPPPSKCRPRPTCRPRFCACSTSWI